MSALTTSVLLWTTLAHVVTGGNAGINERTARRNLPKIVSRHPDAPNGYSSHCFRRPLLQNFLARNRFQRLDNVRGQVQRSPLSNHPESVPVAHKDQDLLFESKTEVVEMLQRRQQQRELETEIQQSVKDLKKQDYGIKLREFMRHATDTGSPEFQIARMTQRIRQLVQHMEVHRKDLHSRRGLEMIVQDRRRMLKYLHKTDLDSYKTICETLGIRDRVPPTPTYPAVGRRFGINSGRQEKLKKSNRPIGMPF
mmetsp:Transcript_15202/g.37279  ORF Transcript_15202/g.37279 Transcript_15202/m.37279 type:complete len:253 (-) Transcript_15202:263-1021(-)